MRGRAKQAIIKQRSQFVTKSARMLWENLSQGRVRWGRGQRDGGIWKVSKGTDGARRKQMTRVMQVEGLMCAEAGGLRAWYLWGTVAGSCG